MSEIETAAHSQPVKALQRANHVRVARSELKAQIADGQTSAAEVILTSPPEIATMPIAQLLASQRGWGKPRSHALLAQAALREDKSIGSLTERQRRTVALLLGENRSQPRGPAPAFEPPGDCAPTPLVSRAAQNGHWATRHPVRLVLRIAAGGRAEDARWRGNPSPHHDPSLRLGITREILWA